MVNTMSIVKITDKKALEQLQAKLTLRLGRKPTQQETLDYCVILANQYFDKLVELAANLPIITFQRVNEIIKERDKLAGIAYDENLEIIPEDDRDIYGN